MDRLLNSRPFATASIVLCGIVLLLSLLGIAGVWVVNYVASSLVIDVTVAVEGSAQSIRRAVLRLDTGIENLRGETQEISQAVTQLSQNVADEGLVRALLPETTEQRIADSATRVAETAEGIRDTLSAARTLYRSLNRLPGVNLPTPDEEAAENVTTLVNQVRGDVQELRSGIAAARQRQADASERVNTITTRIDTRLNTTQDSLNQISGALTNVQTAAQQVRRTVPMWLTISAILLTLFLIWVILTQAFVIRTMWKTLKHVPTAVPAPPAAPGESPAVIQIEPLPVPPAKPTWVPPPSAPGTGS